MLGLSCIVKLIWHEKQIFLSILCGKYCLIHLKIVKILKKLNYNVEILFKTTKPPHNFILFELDFDVKFPLLHLLLFLSVLKSTIFIKNRGNLPYGKALYKRKLISIKKWRLSTNFNKMAKVCSPLLMLDESLSVTLITSFLLSFLFFL